VALSCAFDAKLFLLHCSEQNPFGDDEKWANIESRINQLFTASLAPHLGLATFKELHWEGILRPSVYHIGSAIVQEAANQDIDLIVMRSRRRPRAAIFLGSTAEAVCRSAMCPVLVTHPREREWVGMSTGEIDLNRILIAHDFSRDSEAAVDYGVSLAQKYQAEVHFIHVLATAGHTEPELAWSVATDGDRQDSAYPLTARKLQQSLPQEALLWCKFVSVVRCGRVYEEILAYAREHEIDLICMGISGSDWTIGKMLGTNVDRVLREAPCPVLVTVAGFGDAPG
jgi:nucleotide-binding universal stress UspA family protein